MSFNLPADVIRPVRSVDVRLDAAPHPFAVAHADAAAENWEAAVAANPALFDGEVALLSSLDLDGDALTGRCHIVRYRIFLYWRSLRAAAGAGHFYAHPVLVGSDNALLAIRMGRKTVNAGQVYFAAGSFEPVDFRDGRADLDFNMQREVLEETGIDISGVPHDPDYHVLAKSTGTVLFRRYHFDATADELAEAVRAHVASEDDPEIEGPVIIRNRLDRPSGLAQQMPALIDWHFKTPQ